MDKDLNEVIGAKVSKEEKKKLQERARASGYESTSAYLRHLASVDTEKEPKLTKLTDAEKKDQIEQAEDGIGLLKEKLKDGSWKDDVGFVKMGTKGMVKLILELEKNVKDMKAGVESAFDHPSAKPKRRKRYRQPFYQRY